MKTIGVILSGCGVKDGSEIHESVITLLAIDREGAHALCMAPNISFEAVNHLNELPTGQKRSVLEESARIARGKIRDLASVKAEELDAVILPGGFGAAKNLSDFATKGSKTTVNPELLRLIREMALAKKPIGAMCIAPGTLAAILGKELHPELTIGNDAGTAKVLEELGATHHECKVGEIWVDKKNKIVSTPAYMLATRISEAAEGIEKLVKAVIGMATDSQ